MLTCKECADTSKLRCNNCFNTGHINKDCKLDACWKCKEFHVGHKAHECPKKKPERDTGSRDRNRDKQSKDKTKKKTKDKTASSKPPKDKKTADNKTTNSKRGARLTSGDTVSSSEDNSESDNSDDSDYSDSDGMRFSNKITIRTRHTISHKANDSRPCIVDTGTEEHLAKDESRLLQVEAIHLNHHDAPISIYPPMKKNSEYRQEVTSVTM